LRIAASSVRPNISISYSGVIFRSVPLNYRLCRMLKRLALLPNYFTDVELSVCSVDINYCNTLCVSIDASSSLLSYFSFKSVLRGLDPDFLVGERLLKVVLL
jgi:hypothetical protein